MWFVIITYAYISRYFSFWQNFRLSITISLYTGRVNISRSCFYEYLDELKSYGAEIEYCRKIKSYYYLNDFSIEFEIKIADKTILSNDKLNNIFGGNNKKITPYFIMDGDGLYLSVNQEK